MKRAFAVLVVLAMLLQGAAMGENIIFSAGDYDEGGVWSFTAGVSGESLYVMTRMTESGAYTEGYGVLNEPTEKLDPMEHVLPGGESAAMTYFSSEGHIWAFAMAEDEMSVYEAVFEGDSVEYSELARVDLSDEDLQNFFPTLPVLCGDYLVSLNFGENGYAVYSIDLKNGGCEIFDELPEGGLMEVKGLCALDGTSVIVAGADRSGTEVEIMALTPAEGTLETLCTLPLTGYDDTVAPAYDAENDVFYYITDGVLYAVAGFNADTAAAVPDFTGGVCRPQIGSGAALVWKSYYILCDDATLYAANTDLNAQVQKAQGSVVVCGDELDWMYDVIDDYARKNNGAKVDYVTSRPEGSGIAADIVAQSDAIDIYIVATSSQEFAAMKERGFLMPIGSDAVNEFVAAAFPAIRDALTVDGEAVALPVHIDVTAPGWNPEAFAALGLSEADAPKTWKEFVALLARMPDIIEGTDYTVFDAGQYEHTKQLNLASDIVLAFCRDYVAGVRGEEDALAETLDALKNIDFTRMGLTPEYMAETDERLEGVFELTVFNEVVDISAENLLSDGDWLPMPLSFSDDGEARVDCDMFVMIINPYSSRPQEAAAFIDAVLEGMPGTVTACVRADWTEGIKMEGADDMLKESDDNIASIQAEIDNAADEDTRAQYETMLQDEKDSRDWLIERFYWEVSPEKLAEYQQRVQNMRLTSYIGLEYDDAIDPLLQQLFSGKLDVSAFVDKLTARLDSMLAE